MIILHRLKEPNCKYRVPDAPTVPEKVEVHGLELRNRTYQHMIQDENGKYHVSLNVMQVVYKNADGGPWERMYMKDFERYYGPVEVKIEARFGPEKEQVLVRTTQFRAGI